MPRPARRDGGFTMLELLIVVTIVGTLVVIAVPSLLQARMAANEASAIGSLRVTAAAQKAYEATCGAGYYAASFVVLGARGRDGTPAFISDDMGRAAAPVKSGFAYTLTEGAGSSPGPDDCNQTSTLTRYYATAVPTSPGWTGRRSFAVSTRSVIWEQPGGAAPAEPFGPPAAPIN